jgi:hypothetical protein
MTHHAKSKRLYINRAIGGTWKEDNPGWMMGFKD